MAWGYDDNYRNDSWRDNYDAWKLASPDDEQSYYDEDERAECRHEDREATTDGRVICSDCGFEVWWMTLDDLKAVHDEAVAWERRERRREFWRRISRLTLPIRWPIYRVLNRIWPRRATVVLTDDEIPF